MGIPETAALAHLTWEQQSHYSPLAFCRLWDSPRTSQVRSVRAVLAPGIRYGFILGGNRAGKSDALAQLMTAIALGADHPDAARWCEVNGIPPDRIGWNPGPVWVSSPDFGDSREYVRPKFDALAPAGSIWRNQHADKEATLRYPNGGRVQFKAVQQGRDSYQGSAIKAAGFDEEPNDYAVVKECKMRLVDLDGRMYFSMTPLLGWTELLTEYVEKRPANCAVEYLSGEDNPHLPAGILAELLEGFGDHERESRAHGTIAVLEGLIYGLRRQVHLCSPFEIPAEWARYLGIDFGTANPFAAVFCAHDEGDDVLYVYDLHYQRQWTNKEHAREILRRHKGAPPFRTVQADPSGKDGIMTLNEHGIPAEGAHRDVKGRIAAVQQRMRLDAEGLPHLRVFETEATRPLVKEFESYRWRTGKDEPVKDNDHALDALGYIAQWLRRNPAAALDLDSHAIAQRNPWTV